MLVEMLFVSSPLLSEHQYFSPILRLWFLIHEEVNELITDLGHRVPHCDFTLGVVVHFSNSWASYTTWTRRTRPGPHAKSPAEGRRRKGASRRERLEAGCLSGGRKPAAAGAHEARRSTRARAMAGHERGSRRWEEDDEGAATWPERRRGAAGAAHWG